MVVIRRELPRTRVANPAEKACRIAKHEGSPFRGSLGLRSRGPAFMIDEFLNDLRGRLSLNCDTDSPDEAKHLARHRRDDLLLVLPLRQEPHITLVKPMH
jgi:hypothetical protein